MTLADIYVLVEIKADHERIERRNKGLSAAIAQATKEGAKSVAQLGTVVLGTAVGTELGWLVQSITDADQAFSVVSSEFELQVLALGLLDLIIQQSESFKKQKNFPTVLRAAAILAYGIRPQVEHRKMHPGFKKVALDASERAATLLETQARNVRARGGSANVPKVDASLPAVNDATFPDALKKVLNDTHSAFDQAIKVIQRETTADREEVDILWWLQTGFSKRLGKPLSGVNAKLAWIEIAEDAGALVNIPPALATVPVIEAVIKNIVAKPEESLKIGDLFGAKAQRPSNSTTVNTYAALFPSLLAIDGKLDLSEWMGQTGLRSTIKLSITDWAVWHYKQRILERMVNEAVYAG